MVSNLRRAVDDFNEIVVEKLSKSAFEAQCAWHRVVKSRPKPFFSPQPAQLRRPLIRIQQRSPEYLLPRDLLKLDEQLAFADSANLSKVSVRFSLAQLSSMVVVLLRAWRRTGRPIL
ncbi:hypothetical protein KIN20_000489 [Parelaphostrongylus tenuis]|uniref:Uncharacterized protein n=1 Tax=Parelaphostrongylus tenuis TaxID=148309 RepID=A0AAD5LVJ7_PARTN|nr:hypothetical protein KIN20_000489 [Parelaphostrongylus tenuis]